MGSARAAGSLVLATVNGESPAELVAAHHAIGILDALTLPVVGALLVLRERRNAAGCRWPGPARWTPSSPPSSSRSGTGRCAVRR
jgi:hypothetical protein